MTKDRKISIYHVFHVRIESVPFQYGDHRFTLAGTIMSLPSMVWRADTDSNRSIIDALESSPTDGCFDETYTDRFRRLHGQDDHIMVRWATIIATDGRERRGFCFHQRVR